MNVLAIDTGTVETGYCIVDEKAYRPVEFGKIENAQLLSVIDGFSGRAAIEGFACYGMPVGASTIESITWNGRFIERLNVQDIPWEYVYRKDEKIHICGSMKAKDANIRQALIDRFGEVGTKNNQGFFYGFKADIWTAFAIAVCAIDRKYEEQHK